MTHASAVAQTSQSGAWRILQTGEVSAAETERVRGKSEASEGDAEGFRGRCGTGILEGMRASGARREEKQFGVLGLKNRLRGLGGDPQKRGLAGAGSSGRMDLGGGGSIRDVRTEAPSWLTFDP